MAPERKRWIRTAFCTVRSEILTDETIKSMQYNFYHKYEQYAMYPINKIPRNTESVHNAVARHPSEKRALLCALLGAGYFKRCR